MDYDLFYIEFMTAKNIILRKQSAEGSSLPDYTPTCGDSNPSQLHSAEFLSVEWDCHIIDILHLISDSPTHTLRVTEGGKTIGYINADDVVDSISRLIAPRDDSSIVVIETSPNQFSASSIAIAVEDADANLVDMISSTTEEGMIRVTLRVQHSDPTAVERSLARYGYNVLYSYSKSVIASQLVADRLAQLSLFLNI